MHSSVKELFIRTPRFVCSATCATLSFSQAVGCLRTTGHLHSICIAFRPTHMLDNEARVDSEASSKRLWNVVACCGHTDIESFHIGIHKVACLVHSQRLLHAEISLVTIRESWDTVMYSKILQ